MSVKIIFMGTPSFSVPSLRKLISSKYKILKVYTQPPKKRSRGQQIQKSPVHLVADEAGIEVSCPNDLNNEEDYNFFKKSKVDLVIVVAYGKLIPEKFLKIPGILFINLHASLLPKWRGPAPIERSIQNNDKESGVSIMKITTKLDEGPFMDQVKIKIDKKTTAGSLKDQMSLIGADTLIDAVKQISSGNAKFIDQDHSKFTYAKKIEKLEAEINWNDDANLILSKIRAFNPNPGAWFMYQKQRIKIFDAVVVDLNGEPGKVLDEKLTVASRTKSIRILKLQKEGKKIVDSKSFLAGNKINKGTFLK